MARNLGCGLALLGALVLVGIIGAAGGGVKSGTLPATGSDSPATADVMITACSVSSELGTPFSHATVRITNPTDHTQTYVATISVNGLSGVRVSEINVFSNSLGSHQTVILSGPEATGNVTGTAKGPLKCSVASVNRFPS
jgi:hypothetical protein